MDENQVLELVEFYEDMIEKQDEIMSFPLRGTWIEMRCPKTQHPARKRRSPCGERGLKYVCLTASCTRRHVAPRAGSVD